MKKSKLAIILSKLKVFENPQAELEQYPLDGKSASDFLWNAYQLNDIENKVIGDFGCGTGILGLGALLLGAKKVYFIDKSAEAIAIAKENLKFIEKELNVNFKNKAVFILRGISEFNRKVDVVIENPPFGSQRKHADRAFLKKAIECSKVIYSLHMPETLDFIAHFLSKNHYKLSHIFKLKIQLKKSMFWHKCDMRKMDVIGIRAERLNRKI